MSMLCDHQLVVVRIWAEMVAGSGVWSVLVFLYAGLFSDQTTVAAKGESNMQMGNQFG